MSSWVKWVKNRAKNISVDTRCRCQGYLAHFFNVTLLFWSTCFRFTVVAFFDVRKQIFLWAAVSVPSCSKYREWYCGVLQQYIARLSVQLSLHQAVQIKNNKPGKKVLFLFKTKKNNLSRSRSWIAYILRRLSSFIKFFETYRSGRNLELIQVTPHG